MEWFRSIVLFTAAIGFARWITPGGTFEPYLKFIVSLLTLAVILSPLLAEEELAVWQGTASLPTVTQETWAKETEKIQAVQQLQIREVLARRIAQEAETLLRDDFPGITEKDIEVYIQQESLESGASLPCIVTVHTEETDRAEDIRQQLQSGLRLPQSQIRIEGKESTDG